MWTRGQQALWRADSSAPSQIWAPGARDGLCQDTLLHRKDQAASCLCVTLVTKAAWRFKIIKRSCPPVTLVGQLLMKIRIIKSTYYQISCIQFTPRPTGHKAPACPTHRELASDISCLQLDSHWTWQSNNRKKEFVVVTSWMAAGPRKSELPKTWSQ